MSPTRRYERSSKQSTTIEKFHNKQCESEGSQLALSASESDLPGSRELVDTSEITWSFSKRMFFKQSTPRSNDERIWFLVGFRFGFGFL